MAARLTTRKWWDFIAPLRDCQPFSTGGVLYGVTEPKGDCGQLCGAENIHNRYHADLLVIDYVVYSYETPIAWRVTRHGYITWVLNEHRYSVTTSKHQSKIATAVTSLYTADNRITLVCIGD